MGSLSLIGNALIIEPYMSDKMKAAPYGYSPLQITLHWVSAVLVTLLHLLGALYQQFWLKTGVLMRMLRPEKEGKLS